jgi:hypothetical protein
MKNAIGQGDSQHRVIGEAAEGMEQGKPGCLDIAGLVHRPDDVARDGTQHGSTSPLVVANL